MTRTRLLQQNQAHTRSVEGLLKKLNKEIEDEKKNNADLEQKFDAFRKQVEAERAQLRQQFQEKEYEYEMAKLNWQEKETKLQREILSLKRERSHRN